MCEWVSGIDFIAADVIRWNEAIFHKRRTGKPLRIGERQIVAEVLERGEDGWVRLLVRACTITKDEVAGKTLQTAKAGETIRRASRTLLRGNVERLQWDDESARAAVLASKPIKSRFAEIPKES